MTKTWYENKRDDYYKQWELAMDKGNEKSIKKIQQEYLNYVELCEQNKHLRE